MFTKILIANRGEIAYRVIRTAKKMGISTVAVFSEADSEALHVTEADEAYAVGPAPAQESYLKIENIIAIAKQSGAEAIHPGYGFLSENADFCRACAANHIVFIGPSVEAIEAMGSKSHAKNLMEKAKVPLVPGYQGSDQGPENLKSQAKNFGFPLLIKASAGGGGKGMRLVLSEADFDSGLVSAKREAKQSFNDDKVILEKYLGNARHVEVQVFCDQQGNGIYLGDRDCSMQRRHQKILEEAPAPGLSDSLRIAMGEAAVRAALAINYYGAGTVEFLLDSNEQFYFMEMNTRLQVEHPVTEMVTGLDLVEWQLKVAVGDNLPLQQQELRLNGHAIEARIYAEDCDNDFMPCSGKIDYLHWPETNSAVRIDSGICQGDVVSSHYDPMMAKLIVWGEDRKQALQRLNTVLRQCCVSGLKTNLAFLSKLQRSDAFVEASFTTSYVDKHLQHFQGRNQEADDFLVSLAAVAFVLRQQQTEQETFESSGSPWFIADNWRLNSSPSQLVRLNYENEIVSVRVVRAGNTFCVEHEGEQFNFTAELQDDELTVFIQGERKKHRLYFSQLGLTFFDGNIAHQLSLYQAQSIESQNAARDSSICAPMHGRLIDVSVTVGQTVQEGDAVVVIEAMKMEHTLRAPLSGQVKQINYQQNDFVDSNAVLITFEAI